MKNQNLIIENSKLFSLIFYISLLAGFYFNENLNFGAEGDWLRTDLPVINDLSINIKKTLLNYESYGHRHSPVYLLFLSCFKKIGFSPDSIRFIHLNLSIFLIYLFYRCLSFKFKNVDKNILILLSLVIFLSPTFRSLAIWPSTRIPGLIFLLLSIYEFLKFKNIKEKKYIWSSLFYLIISSYISPNFSVFFIYFIYHYYKKINLSYFFLICLISFLLSIPAFYYIFYLDINFLTAGTPGVDENSSLGLNFNFSNKVLIISSIIFFHFIPFLVDKNIIKDIFGFFKKNIIITLVFFLFNLLFFDYVMNFTGGGFFFQISNYTTKNNLIFYLFSYISIVLIWYFSKNNFNNLIIFCVLIISNIQNTIYHKYYDPTVIILIFTLLSSSIPNNFFKNKKNLIYPYVFYIIYIFMKLFKNYFMIGL